MSLAFSTEEDSVSLCIYLSSSSSSLLYTQLALYTHSAAQDNLNLMTLLHLPLKWWNYRQYVAIPSQLPAYFLSFTSICNDMYRCVYVWECSCVSAAPQGIQKRAAGSPELSYRPLWAIHYWEPHLGPLQEQCVFCLSSPKSIHLNAQNQSCTEGFEKMRFTDGGDDGSIWGLCDFFSTPVPLCHFETEKPYRYRKRFQAYMDKHCYIMGKWLFKVV